MTENQKYVDEIVVFNEKEDKEVLDLMHKDNQSPQENQVYQAEGNSQDFTKNISQLKALSLAMLLTRNPKDTDKVSKLKEVFMNPDQQAECQNKINLEPGFHF